MVPPGSMPATLGFVGPAARACEVPRDVRHDHPYGIFRFAHIPVATAWAGDVLARALVRWLEIQRSLEFVDRAARRLARGAVRVACGSLAARRARRGHGRGLAGGDRPRRAYRAAGASAATRWWIRRSTTGAAWRSRCPGTRSPIFRCATRASTSPTRGTTSDARASFRTGCDRARGRRRSPGAEPEFPERFRGGPVLDRGPLRRDCRECRARDALARCCVAGPMAAGLARRRAPVSSRPRRRRRARQGAIALLRAITAWPRGIRHDLVTRDRGSGPRSGRWRSGAPALRPLAPAALGGGGQLRRLRGGTGGPRQRRVRPGPLRRAVRRLAAPRRRPGHHRRGEPEHAPGVGPRLGGDSRTASS